MVIKIEVYYELTRESNKPFPENSKILLETQISEQCPESVKLSGSWINDDRVIATKLTREALLEKIRTAK